MELRYTHIAPGILRVRRSAEHGETIGERYGILTLPKELKDSGITVTDYGFALPNGKKLHFDIIDENGEEYKALHKSFEDEFKPNYTDFQQIIGAPEENGGENKATADLTPPEAWFAVRFGITENETFYGLGEGNKERVELRGRAYQNWVRYQYNEIAIPFTVSSNCWGVFLNSRARTFTDIGGREKDSLICLGEDDELDLFVLCGDSISDVIKKYTFLTGAPVMLPKWAYGLTYIAPIFANQEEVMMQAERFRREHIPCDMFSLEPGWMTKFYDYSTDKKWDVSRFHVVPEWYKPTSHGEPYRMTFIAALKRFGFKLSLWLCARYDFTAEAERQVVGGDSKDYPEAWYEHLKQHTDLGVDGYKLDPADMVCCFDGMDRPRYFNGLTSMQMHNFNQVLLPKQVYQGYTEQTGLRPMLHYCGGYSGVQRWCGATTGDNGGELGAMIWLQTLALSGQSNTTIDMDIHYPQSVHFGFFVPWAHFNAWNGQQAPWWCGDRQHRMFTEYARLRYRLLPYYYSAALQAHEESVPMIRPMPLAFPEDEAGMRLSKQYMIGDALLVSAYTETVHLPKGIWMNAWTGKEHIGPCDIKVDYPSTRGGGLYVRGGAVIPSFCDRDYCDQYDESEIYLDIYPQGSSSYIFREDDGVSTDYETSPSCHTLISVDECEDEVRVKIGNRDGDYRGKVQKRIWRVRVHQLGGEKRTVSVICDENDEVITENTDSISLFSVDASDIFKIWG